MGRSKQLLWVRQVALLLALLCGAKPASACGASAASGGVAVCTLAEIREKERPKWHVGASYAWTHTKIHFSGDGLVDRAVYRQERQVAVAVAEWRPLPRLNLQLGGGGFTTGWLEFESGGPVLSPQTRLRMRPGGVALLGASYVISPGNGAVPFALVSGQLSGLFASTNNDAKYQAYDLRLGGAVGWAIQKVALPYLLARVFGGPINWQIDGQKVLGTDRYHYQVGAGVSAVLAQRWDLFVEGVFLGERGVSGGVGFAF